MAAYLISKFPQVIKDYEYVNLVQINCPTKKVVQYLTNLSLNLKYDAVNGRLLPPFTRSCAVCDKNDT